MKTKILKSLVMFVLVFTTSLLKNNMLSINKCGKKFLIGQTIKERQVQKKQELYLKAAAYQQDLE